MAGFPVININEGTLKGGCRTSGGVHEESEIYYIVEGCGILWLDDDSIPVKSGDVIIIPPNVWHWIDNTMNKEDFKLNYGGGTRKWCYRSNYQPFFD